MEQKVWHQLSCNVVESSTWMEKPCQQNKSYIKRYTGVFIPHLKNEHAFLPTSLPSQGYGWKRSDNVVEIPYNLRMVSNEYETGLLK